MNLSRFSQPHHIQVILILFLPYPVVLTRFQDSLYSCEHLGTFSWFASSSTVCFFLDVCNFPRSWDASLCSFLVIFFFFLLPPVGKLLCYRWFSIFFYKTQKNRVILGNYLWKGNQVLFELFCFLLLDIWNLQGKNSCAKFLTRIAMINQKGMTLRKHVMQRRKCSGSLVRHRLD